MDPIYGVMKFMMVLFSLHEFQVGGTSSSGREAFPVEDCDANSG